MASTKKRRHIGRYVFLFFILLIFGMDRFGKYNAKKFNDTFLATYVPKPEVEEIAVKTTMTDKAKLLFYQADPEFIGSDKFKEYCITREGIELALACARSTTPGQTKYAPRVFLLQFDNPKFADSKFPSAAHELLHLVYKQLGKNEITRLAPLIDAELEKHQDDVHLMNIVDIVKKSQGDQYQEELRNELHSIFGVEFADLSPELEQHYAQYFGNRSQVVAFHQNSGLVQAVRKLDELTWEVNQLEVRLQQLGAQNPSDPTEYNNLVNQHNALVRQGKTADQEVQALYKLINPDYTPQPQ